MVKSIRYIDKTIFDYLGEEEYAVLICETGLCEEVRLNDGVLLAQYNEKNEITAIIATAESERVLVFPSENTNFEEIEFLQAKNRGDENRTEKKYLMRIRKIGDTADAGCEKSQFARMKSVDGSSFSRNAEIVSLKMLLKDMGKCKGVLITENGEDIGSGFIQFSQNISIITDVYIKEARRRNGYGKRLVENLLSCSEREIVYLVSREENIKFYKKCGFEAVKEIREM